MASDTENHGAEEGFHWQKATKRSDAAFHAAMAAAGYKLLTITEPQTEHARVTRGEPCMITRGTSPASQCYELGSKSMRDNSRAPGERRRERPSAPRALSATEIGD